jgi:hypothetical protein
MTESRDGAEAGTSWDALLHKAKDRQCENCKSASIVIRKAWEGDALERRCRNRACQAWTRIPFPKVRRDLWYLDTSTISEIARASAEPDSLGAQILEVFETAARDETVSFVWSGISEREAEFSERADTINNTGRRFGDTHRHSELEIRFAQLRRGLSGYLEGALPNRETAPPVTDLGLRNLDSLSPPFRISLEYSGRHPALRGAMPLHSGWKPVADVLERYAASDLSLRAISRREALSRGPALIREYLRKLELAKSGIAPKSIADTLLLLTPTDVEVLSSEALRVGVASPELALTKALEFLTSDHAALTADVSMQGDLYALIVGQMRKKAPRRQLRQSDVTDITHAYTYFPYVDVFLADRSFATLLNSGKPSLAALHDTLVVRSTDVATMSARVKHLGLTSPQVPLARLLNGA